MATYPKKTGITNIDDAVYYLEEQMTGIAGQVLPPLPTDDGEYTLTLVVESGVPGLVWEESV
jgi:hypothetical protein